MRPMVSDIVCTEIGERLLNRASNESMKSEDVDHPLIRSWCTIGILMADSLLAVAVAPLTAFALAKVSELSAEQRRIRTLDQAQKEVAFWKSWYETRCLVCTSDELPEIKILVSREFMAIQARLGQLAALEPKRTLPASKTRRILLWYKPASGTSWLARVAFYGLAAYGVLLSVELAAGFSSRDSDVLAIGLGIVVIVIVSAIWSRNIAVKIDHGVGV